VVDVQSVPLGIHLDRAWPAEVTLVQRKLQEVRVPRRGPGRPRSRRKRLIAHRAYDSDTLRQRVVKRGIRLICPHRKNRRKPPTQDGRPLRRYRPRWKLERTFPWLGNMRPLVVRYKRSLSI
jgi:transposase